MTTFNGTLDVTISDAQLMSSQHLSQQDPYCILTLGSSGVKCLVEGSSLGKERFKTKVHNGGGQRPVWNETHTFNLKNMKLDSHLKVKFYDKDTIKDDYIGLATINLEQLLLHDKKGIQYFPLHKKTSLMGSKDQNQQPLGQVGIGVNFNCTEIPQGHADLKSQVRDVVTRKDQQFAGVSEPYQQAKPTHIQGQGQMQPSHQSVVQPQQHQQLGGGIFGHKSTVPQTQTQTHGTFPQQQGTIPQQQQGMIPQQQGTIPQQQGTIPQQQQIII
jgi:hypothetical protein